MATATVKNEALSLRISRRLGIELSEYQTSQLRRIEKTLSRWYELECGTSNDYGTSFHVDRDADGKPRMHVCTPSGRETSYTVPDREAGAIRRLQALCKETGLHYYIQGDPRGCALYVSNVELPDNNYTQGVACCD